MTQGVTSKPGIDYAWDRPSIAALKAWGAQFVCRYLSHDTRKDETLAEAHLLAAAGIWSVVVYESTAKRSTAGTAAGKADATLALSLARALHMPEDRPIYFAVDFDVQSFSDIKAYFEGVASVLGAARSGVYGGYKACKWLYEAGLVKWVWQTYAWSGGKWFVPSHIQQYHNDITVGGVGVDADRATTTDYGQWMPGVSPVPTPLQEEDEMPYGQVNTGSKAITPIALPRGKYRTIGFSCDNGLQEKPPAQIRVAVHRKAGWKISTVTVDSTKGQSVVTFDDPATTDTVSLQRADNGDVLVAWEVS